jgi:hypothetical protein
MMGVFIIILLLSGVASPLLSFIEGRIYMGMIKIVLIFCDSFSVRPFRIDAAQWQDHHSLQKTHKTLTNIEHRRVTLPGRNEKRRETYREHHCPVRSTNEEDCDHEQRRRH